MATSPCMKASCSAPMDAPTAADRIRNPGYRPTYSYGLAHPISKNSLMRGMVHSWLPSGTFIVSYLFSQLWFPTVQDVLHAD